VSAVIYEYIAAEFFYKQATVWYIWTYYKNQPQNLR